LITLVDVSSIAPDVVRKVRSPINRNDTVLVILDSNHTRDHVFKELQAYHDLVTPGSYIVVTDGSMREMADVPRGKPEWTSDSPMVAASEFVATDSEFIVEQPPWVFNESDLSENITHWPEAWLRRVS
jgi:cephalosporin hydroxylase